MRYPFLLFDLDRTLLDFDRAEEVALTQFLQAKEVADVEAYKAYYKPMNQKLWQDFEEKKISKQELINSRFARLFAHFGKEVDGECYAKEYQGFIKKQGQTLAGASDLLATLRQQGYHIYAATNGVTAIQKGRLEASGLAPLFEKVFISEQTGYQKPDPAFFEVVAKAIPNFAKERALMIGDSLSADIKGGNQAGIATVWFNPKRITNPTTTQPTYVVASYQELLELLKTHA